MKRRLWQALAPEEKAHRYKQDFLKNYGKI